MICWMPIPGRSTGVVGQVAEAVVHIQVQKPATDRRGGQQKLAPGSGSGFVISSDGFIVTNNHVIENARDIRVSLADGRTVNAELKGTDEPAPNEFTNGPPELPGLREASVCMMSSINRPLLPAAFCPGRLTTPAVTVCWQSQGITNGNGDLPRL